METLDQWDNIYYQKVSVGIHQYQYTVQKAILSLASSTPVVSTFSNVIDIHHSDLTSKYYIMTRIRSGLALEPKEFEFISPDRKPEQHDQESYLKIVVQQTGLTKYNMARLLVL